MAKSGNYATRFLHNFAGFVCSFTFITIFLTLAFFLLIMYKLEGGSFWWGVVFIPIYLEWFVIFCYMFATFVNSLDARERACASGGCLERIPCFAGMGPWTFFSLWMTGWIIGVIFTSFVLVVLRGDDVISYEATFWPPIAYFLLVIIVMMITSCNCIGSVKKSEQPKREMFNVADEEEGVIK